MFQNDNSRDLKNITRSPIDLSCESSVTYVYIYLNRQGQTTKRIQTKFIVLRIVKHFRLLKTRRASAAGYPGPSHVLYWVFFLVLTLDWLKKAVGSTDQESRIFIVKDVYVSLNLSTTLACLLKAINRRFEISSIFVVCQAIDPGGRLWESHLKCIWSKKLFLPHLKGL